MTYFVFDVSPGEYVASFESPSVDMALAEERAFLVLPGKQVYIGDFALAPMGRLSASQGVISFGPVAFTQNLKGAKMALGPGAFRLEIAEATKPTLQNRVLCRT